MNFQEFLNKNESVRKITKEVTVGKRFKDENGDDFVFKIKPISAAKYSEIQRSSVEMNASGKIETDSSKMYGKVVLECCVYPNFKDTGSIKARGLHTPGEYLDDVLLPGEIIALGNKILDISGFGTSINELIKEAKN